MSYASRLLIPILALAQVAVVAVAGRATALQASAAWVRWLPGDLPAAGYLTLTNEGDTPLTLTGASSPDFATTMLHQSREENGMERMLPVTSILVPPHGRVQFAPGGYHLMLMQPQHSITPGAHVVVTFKLAGDATITVPFEVRGPDGRPATASP